MTMVAPGGQYRRRCPVIAFGGIRLAVFSLRTYYGAPIGAPFLLEQRSMGVSSSYSPPSSPTIQGRVIAFVDAGFLTSEGRKAIARSGALGQRKVDGAALVAYLRASLASIAGGVPLASWDFVRAHLVRRRLRFDTPKRALSTQISRVSRRGSWPSIAARPSS